MKRYDCIVHTPAASSRDLVVLTAAGEQAARREADRTPEAGFETVDRLDQNRLVRAPIAPDHGFPTGLRLA